MHDRRVSASGQRGASLTTLIPLHFTLELDLAPADTELEKVSWPRGVYIIDPVNPHAFRLRDFDVTDGFALVARATVPETACGARAHRA